MFRNAFPALVLLAALAPAAAAQTLKATPASVSFTYTLGSATLPASQSVAVAPSSGAALTFTAVISGGSWLTVSPDSGKTNLSVKLTANPTTLPVGTYVADLVLTPTGGTALAVPVTLVVKAPPATLIATPNPVTISYNRGDPLPSPVALTLSGGGALLSYNITVTGATWLAATPKSGIIFPAFSMQVALSVDPTGLAPGTYKGSVKIDAPSAANKTQTVDVNLIVNPGPPTLSSIFPLGVTQGTAATTITLSGSNLYSGTTVTAGTTTLVATLLGPTAMQATIPASLLATAGTLAISVSNPNPGGGTSAAQSFTVFPPGPRITGVTNGASYQSGAIAPGELVSIFGTGLGPDTIVTFQTPTTGNPVSSTLAGVDVLFGSTPAPLIFVSATQIAAMVPYTVTGSATTVTVQYNAQSSASYPVGVASAAPGVFALGASGSGAGAVFNYNESTGDLTLNNDTNPALRGSTVWIFATGAGGTNPTGTDGIIGSSEIAYSTPTATVTFAGTDVVPDYFGHAPGLVSGLLLIKAKVPAGLTASKTVPILVTIGGVPSQTGVTIGVK